MNQVLVRIKSLLLDEVLQYRLKTYVILTALCATADVVSKGLVFREFGVHNGTDWLLDGWLKFRFFTSLNPGALWGVGQGFALGFAAVSVVALVGIWYWLFWRQAARSAWLTTALSFVSAGTVGNLCDRLGMHALKDVNGQPIFAVRDFLDFRFGSFDWAIFNIADICLVTGAAMLMLQSLTTPQESAIAASE